MTSEYKQLALQSLKGKWKLAAGVTFLYQFILSSSSSVLYAPFMIAAFYFINTMLEELAIASLSVVYFIISLCFTGILTLGYLKLLLQIARSEEAEVDFLFAYFGSIRQLFQGCMIMIRITIYTLLWSILLIVPGIIKSFSYSMTYFVLLDHPEYTIQEAMAESERLMKGKKRELFGLWFSFLGWFLVVMLTFGLAIFWVLPYMSTAYAHFYLRLREEGAS